MKLGFIVFALTTAFSTNSFAFQCNTVMGGCPTDDALGTSSHMRSQIVNKAVTTKSTPTSKTPVAPMAPVAAGKTAVQNKTQTK